MEDLRKCKGCGVEQKVDLFVKAGEINGKIYCRYLCSPCYTQYKKPRRDNNRKDFMEYKSQFSCEYCGNNDIRVLDFDHIDPSQKSFNLADAVRKGYGIDKIMAEAQKCRVLCSNCHRIKKAL